MKKIYILISVILVGLFVFTLIFVNINSSKEKAKKNTKGFLSVVFDSPDPELNKMFTQMFTSVSSGSENENIDIGKRMKDLFSPYFAETFLDKAVIVWGTFGPIFEGSEYSSKIQKNSIKITQKKKEKNALDFFAIVEYNGKSDTVEKAEISGDIRYDMKTGKLTYFKFSLDTQRVIAEMQKIAKEDTESLN